MSREFHPRRIIRNLKNLREDYRAVFRTETTDIRIGEFMEVAVMPGNPVAELHFHKDLPLIAPNEGLISYSRKLLDQTKQSLTDLALLCQNNDPRLTDVIGFEAISRVVGSTAEKLGFDVSEIPDGWPKVGIKLICTYSAFQESWRNKQSRRFLRKLVEPKVAYISRQRLTERFTDT